MASLSEQIAEAFFGWKWMAYVGTPTRDTDGYPEKQRVRQFFSPQALQSDAWKDFLAKNEAAPATGKEPLSYRYCSSQGPAFVPQYASDRNACFEMEEEIQRRGLWPVYRKHLLLSKHSHDLTPDDEYIHFVDCQKRCRAALKALKLG